MDEAKRTTQELELSKTQLQDLRITISNFDRNYRSILSEKEVDAWFTKHNKLLSEKQDELKALYLKGGTFLVNHNIGKLSKQNAYLCIETSGTIKLCKSYGECDFEFHLNKLRKVYACTADGLSFRDLVKQALTDPDREKFIKLEFDTVTHIITSNNSIDIIEMIGSMLRKFNFNKVEQIQRLKTQLFLSTNSFDKSNSEHLELLYSFCKLIYPDREMQIPSDVFSDVGFQNKDPSTDFRSMGIFSLHLLIYYSRIRNVHIRQVLSLKPHYPWAVAGINVAMFLLNKVFNVDVSMIDISTVDEKWNSCGLDFVSSLAHSTSKAWNQIIFNLPVDQSLSIRKSGIEYQAFEELFCFCMDFIQYLYQIRKASYM
jgi:hypothetical protein